MNIGINCTDVLANYRGGVNTYTFGLLQAFAEQGANHKFQIYVNEENQSMFEAFVGLPNFEVISVKKVDKIGRGLRHVGTLMKSRKAFAAVCNFQQARLIGNIKGRSDVLYAPTTVLPYFSGRTPTIVSIHDIQQFHFPHFFSKRELAYREIAYGLTVDRANYIQASSEFIREDLVKNYPHLDRDKIFVVNEGVDIETFSRRKSFETVVAKYQLNPYEFLFMPAQLWQHKNHITVLKALARLRDEGYQIPLVMTGAKYAAADSIFRFIEDNGLSQSVRYLGVVPFEDIQTLYQMSKFMITAVLYESSSLPILESAASGRPIVASKTPPNVEMAQNLSLNLFDSLDFNELAALLKSIWNDNELIDRQIAANNMGIFRYSWGNAAKKYIEFIERMPKHAAS